MIDFAALHHKALKDGNPVLRSLIEHKIHRKMSDIQWAQYAIEALSDAYMAAVQAASDAQNRTPLPPALAGK